MRSKKETRKINLIHNRNSQRKKKNPSIVQFKALDHQKKKKALTIPSQKGNRNRRSYARPSTEAINPFFNRRRKSGKRGETRLLPGLEWRVRREGEKKEGERAKKCRGGGNEKQYFLSGSTRGPVNEIE